MLLPCNIAQIAPYVILLRGTQVELVPPILSCCLCPSDARLDAIYAQVKGHCLICIWDVELGC